MRALFVTRKTVIKPMRSRSKVPCIDYTRIFVIWEGGSNWTGSGRKIKEVGRFGTSRRGGGLFAVETPFSCAETSRRLGEKITVVGPDK